MSKAKILLVDDDEAVFDYMRAKLGSRYELITTGEPDRVVDLAREHRPDLIVCDVDMPGTDGGDVSAALYGNDATHDIPLLFLTGLLSPQDMEQKKGVLGGRPAISKTAPAAELIARIDSLLKP